MKITYFNIFLTFRQMIIKFEKKLYIFFIVYNKEYDRF